MKSITIVVTNDKETLEKIVKDINSEYKINICIEELVGNYFLKCDEETTKTLAFEYAYAKLVKKINTLL